MGYACAVDLTDCLPAALRTPTTAIAPIGAGQSGALVFRVDAGGATYVLKVARADEPTEAWRARLAIQRAAVAAGVAPAIVHVDDDRRAVTSAFVEDRALPALFGDPATRGRAVALLGTTLRRVHDLPLATTAPRQDPREMLRSLERALAGVPMPAFVAPRVAAMLAEAPPPAERADVLSHNDVNPSNLAFDGDRLFLLDWDIAGINEPFYDLAAIAMFLRMDEAACLDLLAAHDGARPAAVPARFAYDRRLVGVLCGAAFLRLACKTGHPGDATTTGLRLAAFYPQLRAGAVGLGTPEGRWAFGLALLNQ